MTLINAKQSYYSNLFNSERNKLIVSFKGDFNNYMSTNREHVSYLSVLTRIISIGYFQVRLWGEL